MDNFDICVIMGNLLDLTALPQTTKADKALHGFGLRSVNSVLKRYGGTMTITQEDNSYTASLLIPINVI